MPKIILERHAYAPELNKAHIVRQGRIVATLPAPRAETIAGARNQLFGRNDFGPIMATVKKIYPAPWERLSRTWCGAVPSRLYALKFMRAKREIDQGAPSSMGKHCLALSSQSVRT